MPPRIWIFGYGSLISGSSRARTCTELTGEAVPAVIRGLKRGWYAAVSLPPEARANTSIPATQAVGVIESDLADARCSGVIFAAAKSALAAFDVREIGYRRSPVAWNRVQAFNEDDQAQLVEAEACGDELFCYVPESRGTSSSPSAAHPVLQTYLDVMLEGCEEISEEFAREFVRTTDTWPSEKTGAFLDDRGAPGYVRSSATASAKCFYWDALLEDEVPGLLACRSLGPAESCSCET
eukprot:TRINITY_DN33807_c0_g1_i1.p1 TRINITY_DN33807_c0_g1~~TRINITY_DN33807_c0_g1_i1.p1  ORF type:complete len:254 (+),score=38.78 TRINITY_DN33807_c0_g1_i1:51-764(+)